MDMKVFDKQSAQFGQSHRAQKEMLGWWVSISDINTHRTPISAILVFPFALTDTLLNHQQLIIFWPNVAEKRWNNLVRYVADIAILLVST